MCKLRTKKYWGSSKLFMLVLSGMLTACSVNKYIPENQVLLIHQEMHLLADDNLVDKKKLSLALKKQLIGLSNPKALGFFYIRQRIWYRLQDPGDTLKWDRFQFKNIAKSPIMLDSQMIKAKTSALNAVLVNNGLFDGKVETKVVRKIDKRGGLQFNVYPGKQYLIESIQYLSEDSIIQQYIDPLAKGTLFKIGKRVEASTYDFEVLRITKILKNEGFADINKSHFKPVICDTTGGSAKIKLVILPPVQGKWHKKYVVGNVNCYVDYLPNQIDSFEVDTIVNGIRILAIKAPACIRPSSLEKLIYIRPGEVFSQTQIDFTTKRLSALPYYKFLRLRPERINISSDSLDINIQLTPASLYSTGYDWEFNSENNTGLNQSLIGTAFSVNFKNRNYNRTGTTVSTNAELGLAINLSLSDLINTVDFKINNEVNIPRFNNFLGIYSKLNKTIILKNPIMTNGFYQSIRKLATTTVNSGVNYTRIFNQYTVFGLNLNYGIDYQKSNNERYQINHSGITYLRTNLESQFKELIKDNAFLLRSLAETQFFTGLLFRDFTYQYKSTPNIWNEEINIRFQGEISGLEVYTANKLVNLARQKNISFNEQFQFAQFTRLEIDSRYKKQYSSVFTVAARLHTGITNPFGSQSQVPYVKQFFVGGPNSMRAWRIRELGPGRFSDPEAGFPFYQQGSFLLETNLELRFKLFWLFYGAIFIDAGNVWELNASSYDGKGALRWDSYKDIAIGSGFGLRLDINYIILRLDSGIKVKDQRTWVLKPNKIQLADFNPNLAIAYPF